MATVTLEERSREIKNAMDAWIQEKRDELEQRQAEYTNLKELERIAGAHGDRSENAEWQTARDEAAHCGVLIQQIEDILNLYDTVGKEHIDTGVISIGSTVHLQGMGEDWYFRIYPKGLGKATLGALSVDTPVGKAILGKTAGEVVKVKASASASGIIYTIKEVL